MQVSMFDGGKRFKIDKPIRLVELFAGIGAQAKALERLGVPFEHYRICEFDKYAVKSYNAIHGTNFATSDVTKITANDLGIVDTDKYCYILTYSFPCTDLSLAGKQQGMAKGSGTRSGLLWEVERLLKEIKELPQVLVMENVPEVIGQKNIKHFAEWIAFLDTFGYKSKWQVLNATDFNVPQNRRRCFMVSILGDYYYEFPKPIGCKLKLKDILESNVDDKYYLSNSTLERIASWNAYQDSLKDIDKEKVISPTITARGAGEEHSGMILINEATISKTVRAGGRGSIDRHSWDIVIEPICINSKVNGKQPSLQNRIYDTNGSATAVTTAFMPNILVPEAKAEYCDELISNGIVEEYDVVHHNYTEARKSGQKRLWNKQELISPTLDTRSDCLGVCVPNNTNLRIRKLTPRECFRLMDFDDDDFDKVKAAGISDNQCYKQAGNSIVVAVLMAIFKQML